jgi:hypothetical protein
VSPFLQITTMSEIPNDIGDAILPQAINVKLLSNGDPTLWELSKSLLKWPHQPLPSKKAWSIWKRLLKRCQTPSGKLRKPLGAWLPNHAKHRQWQFTTDGSQLVSHWEQPKGIYTNTINRYRHSITFQRNYTTTLNSTTTTYPVTPLESTATYVKCRRQEFHMQPEHRRMHQGYYKIFEVPHIHREGTHLDVLYTFNITDYIVDIVGIVRQQHQTTEILRLSKKYNNRPSVTSANAWSCLLIASHLHHYHSIDPTVTSTFYLQKAKTKHLLKSSSDPQRTPNQCYTLEWEIYAQASMLLKQSKTVFKVCTDDLVYQR